MNKKSKTLRAAAIVLAVAALLALIFGGKWFLNHYVVVGWIAYSKSAASLDLRGTGISVERYEDLQQRLPNCEIRWEVPFQGGIYADDTKELTVTSLTDEDVALLDYLTELKTVNAQGCRDYEQLLALQQRHPDCQVLYSVCIGGEEYSQDTKELTLTDLTEEEVTLLDYLPQLTAVHAESCRDYDQLNALQQRHPDCQVFTVAGDILGGNITELTVTDMDAEGLLGLLDYLPQLEKVHLIEPTGEAEGLLQLLERYPQVDFYWEKDVLGVHVTSEDTEVDFSGIVMDSVDAVAEAMESFPNAQKVIMCDCGIDNETMAAFRESERENYKVVWSVQCGKLTARTDDTFFMPVKYGVYYFFDEDAYNLRYCEDMICIDVGHMAIHNIAFVEFMPHLKYLILAHSQVLDISPISACKELVFLELDWTGISDYSPLVECTALEDLNLGLTYGDPEPISRMTWLKNLWWKGRNDQVQSFLAEALPNTHMEFQSALTVGNGWRKLQNYYDMRDVLGMYYMD